MRSIRVWVPGHRVRFVESELTALFHLAGGTTRVNANGGWITPTGVVIEPVVVFEFITDKDVSVEIQAVVDKLKASGEKSVLVTNQEIEVIHG